MREGRTELLELGDARRVPKQVPAVRSYVGAASTIEHDVSEQRMGRIVRAEPYPTRARVVDEEGALVAVARLGRDRIDRFTVDETVLPEAGEGWDPVVENRRPESDELPRRIVEPE